MSGEVGRIDVLVLKQLYPQARMKTLTLHCTHLIDALNKYAINTGARMAAFFAQTGHETLDLLFLEERWGPTPQQLKYDCESNSDLAKWLGNDRVGDGEKYRGRGLIHLTGKGNYKQCGDAIHHNLVMNPEIAAEPHCASKVAAWYWHTHQLNKLADQGLFDTITQKINGGFEGKPDRDFRYARALKVLGVNQIGAV